MQNCSSVKPIVKPVEKAQLENGTWVLKSLKGKDAKTVFTGKTPNLKFDFSNNLLSGFSGCNRYTGNFTLNEQNVFSAPNLVTTMMACLPGNKEPLFVAALSTPDLVVSLTKEKVLTFTEGKSVVLEFVKTDALAASVPATIVNVENLTGKWELISIAGGDLAALFTNQAPTMEISAEGRVFGNAGCNRYNAPYTLDGNTMTFGAVVATKMACPNLKGEELFTSLLSAPLQTGLNGDRLAFYKDGNIVLEFTKVVE
ncbi:MAG: META domain-containing protein [Prevotella sp.]|jgi:heat shock protein HslJ|nr:META domain-containing protein [Prevotella sp.]